MNKDSTNVVSMGVTSGDPLIAEDPGPTSHTQWGAILAGSLAGFAATILMTTLGMAIGATTGAFAAEDPGTDPGKAAAVAGIGAAVWTLLTALVAGFTGGAVLNRMARYDRPYMPMAFGALTWTGGVVLALFLASSAGMGVGAAVGGGAAGAGAALKDRMPSLDRAMPRAEQRSGDERSVGASPQEKQVTPEQAQEAAKKATKGAAAGAWLLLGAQLVSLAATMLAARWRKAREIPVKVGARLG